MSTVLASSGHTPFYISAGIFAAWAVVVGTIGIMKADFPENLGGYRVIGGVTVVLMLSTVSLAIATAEKPDTPHTRPEPVLGVVPQPQGGGASAEAAAPAAPAAGPVAIAADPTGALAYQPNTASAQGGEVTINFTNKSPLPHNLLIEKPGGGDYNNMPPFAGGTKTVKVKLTAGTYTFYCSVPGHRQAGMVGKLTVS
jgi:plastocyanin